VAFPRFASLALVLPCAEGARVSRKKSAAGTKFIAGVPVLDYHAAYGGKAVLGELEREAEQEWNVFLERGIINGKVKSLCQLNANGCILEGHPTGGVPFLKMRGTEVDLENVIKGGVGLVKFVEPDQDDISIPIEDDAAQAASTWGLDRIGADSRGSTGSGVSVYVQDTGVRSTHQEFGGRAASALDVTSGAAVECNGDLGCAGDKHGHGTHCAGTAAGANYGVAPEASVRALKTLSDAGSGQRSWQYIAIDWLTVSGDRPAVLSMSLGGSGQDQGYAEAIDAAVDAGVVVVTSAGNRNADACLQSPAFVPSAITVGSIDSTDTRSSFSSYGACVDIWAPGSGVVSAGVDNDAASATKSGTSMACPHVSGAAALVLSRDPSKTPSAVLQELYDNAAMDVIHDLTGDDTNALLFVGEGGAPPSPPVAPTPAPPLPCDLRCADNKAYCDYPHLCGGCSECCCAGNVTCCENDIGR